jgi:hypothetical protein
MDGCVKIGRDDFSMSFARWTSEASSSKARSTMIRLTGLFATWGPKSRRGQRRIPDLRGLPAGGDRQAGKMTRSRVHAMLKTTKGEISGMAIGALVGAAVPILDWRVSGQANALDYEASAFRLSGSPCR